MNDLTCADNVIGIVNEFGAVSGLDLNVGKCDFMWLGKNQFNQ